ncbi:MAG: CotH kinase family protein, partial [Planctomycetota bacterium]
TKGAAIYYTLDGSEPYKLGGRFPNGIVYTGPISISKTTFLRAIAVKHGWKSSTIDTQTYIFLNDAIHQSAHPAGFPSSWGGTSADYQMDPDIVNNPFYSSQIRDDLKSIPTMSLVMTKSDLFDSSKGIYANWNSQGVAWERPASIELIYPDGTKGFQANCGARIYGGVGRREKKKTFRLLFKGIYGDPKLRYPFFGEDAVDEFDTIILRANFNDGYPFGKEVSQLIRDEFCRRLQLALGYPSAHGRFVHLYVNGLYWGLYNPVERPDASFAASYFGGDKDDWDAYNSGNPTGESSWESWNAFRNAIRSGIESNAGFQRLQGNNPDGTPDPQYTNYLDIESYIDYMLLNIFVGNTDWPGHNWYGAMNRLNSTGFHFFSWDAEWVIWLTVGHGLDSSLYENMTGVSNSLCEAYARLRSNAKFRQMFGDHVHKAFFNGGPMYVDPTYRAWNPAYPERNQPAALYSELADYIERAMIAETARWGDVHGGSPRTIEHWRNERNRILGTYMAERPQIVLDQLRNANLYPRVDAPVFRINGLNQHDGQISPDDMLSMTATTGTIWYTLDGSDPSQSQQNGSSDTTLVAENADKKVLVPTGPVNNNWKSALAFNDLAWSDCTGSPGGVGYERGSGYEHLISLDLQAQMYNKNSTCYIRIPFNLDGSPDKFNSMTLKVRYDDAFIAYLNGTEVARKNFNGTPTWNSSASTSHSDYVAVEFESIDISAFLYTLQQGDNLLAIQGLNTTRTGADFLISTELIAAEEGSEGGLKQYTGPITLSHSANVKARVLSGNTWSALNEAVFAIGPVADNLRITETMYHPQNPANPNDPNDPNEEYIELKNIGSETINLNLVSFTNGIDVTFPSMELAAGEYVVVVQDRNAFEARYGSAINIAGQYSGRLNNGGEGIRLQDAIGQTILDFSYKDGWRSITDGEGFSLTIIDPTNPDPNSWDEKDSWRASAYAGGSP